MKNTTDFLTGLLDRNSFYYLADQARRQADAETPFNIIYFNIDRFKAYNDSYGFEAGDILLCDLAHVLQQAFYGEIVARLADDHFVALTSKSNITRRIEHIHELVHQAQQEVVLELNAGIYTIPSDVSIAKACDRARMACDSIKHQYNRKYRYFDSGLSERLSREKFVIDNIENAIRQGQIKVYYQPVVRVMTDVVCGMESLVRWDVPEWGMLSPGEFIPVLEKYSLIHKLDTFVIEQVCRDFVETAKTQETLIPVSINLSRMDFQLCDIYQILVDTMDRYQIDRELVHVEVTESVLSANIDHLTTVIQRFRDAGFEVWLDDFGSAYSTLNSLQSYSFDVLKIDMKFFAEFESNPASRIIIESVVDMAKKLNMRTVAEGVETAEEYAFLKNLGCDIAQGYYHFKPTPLVKLLDDINRVEDYEDKRYFNMLSRINLLSNDPMGNLVAQDEKLRFSAPVALVEFKDGHLHYLSHNKSYLECLNTMGVETIVESEAIINDPNESVVHLLASIVKKCRITQKTEGIDFVFRGNYCNLTVRQVAVSNRAVAFFVSMINLSSLENVKKMTELESSLHFLYTIYKRVDILDVSADSISNIFLNSSAYQSEFGGKDLLGGIREYAQKDIAPEDRDRFISYYDIDTLNSRLNTANTGYLLDIFHGRANQHEFCLQKYYIIPVGDQQSVRYMSCVRNVHMETAEKLAGMME